uniref:Uncharacterized protein n=1 Tax=Rhizophora mucronata TaxID=61149 RepID=A0A2P2PT56_RHIMU
MKRSDPLHCKREHEPKMPDGEQKLRLSGPQAHLMQLLAVRA